MKHSMLLKKDQEEKEVTTAYIGGDRKANSFSRFGKKINFEAVVNEENEQHEIESNEIEIQDDQASEGALR